MGWRRHTYPDAHGSPIIQVRIETDAKGSKRVSQYSMSKSGIWVPGIHGMSPVPYNLPELLEAVDKGQEIWVVEGEKDADAILALGLVATCNLGGAGKWRDSDSRALPYSDVNLVWDHDGESSKFAGQRHALKVAASLRAVGTRVTFFRAAVGKDVSDHLAAGYSLEQLVEEEPVAPEAISVERRSRRSEGKSAVLALVISKTDARSVGDGQWQARCPAHDDRAPSLSIAKGDLHPVVLTCHAGCSLDAIADALEMDVADLCGSEVDDVLKEVRRLMGLADAERAPTHAAELLTLDDLNEIPEPDWLVRDYMPSRGVTMLYGPPGIGKTFLLTGLGLSTETGSRYLGQPVRQAGVVFYAAEGVSGLAERRRSYQDFYGIDARRHAVPVRFLPRGVNLDDPFIVAQVVRTIQGVERDAGQRVGLVIFDPLIECMTGDENGEGMDDVSRGLRAISILLDCSVVVGHHTNIEGSERGSRKLRARIHAAFKVEPLDGGYIGLLCDKQRHGTRRAMRLALESHGESAVPVLIEESSADDYRRTAKPKHRSSAASRPQRSDPSPEAAKMLVDAILGEPGISKNRAVEACLRNGIGRAGIESALRSLIEDETVTVSVGAGPTHGLRVAASAIPSLHKP